MELIVVRLDGVRLPRAVGLDEAESESRTLGYLIMMMMMMSDDDDDDNNNV